VTLLPAKRLVRAAKSGMGVFSLGIFLLVQIMAAAPSVHAWFHHDAARPGHDCAVTMFLHGQVHAPATTVNAAITRPVFGYQLTARSADFISADVHLLPSRGPPA
jgi:hypothetical protein